MSTKPNKPDDVQDSLPFIDLSSFYDDSVEIPEICEIAVISDEKIQEMLDDVFKQ